MSKFDVKMVVTHVASLPGVWSHVIHDGSVHFGVPLAHPEVGDGYFRAVRPQCRRIQSLGSFGRGLGEIIRSIFGLYLKVDKKGSENKVMWC